MKGNAKFVDFLGTPTVLMIQQPPNNRMKIMNEENDDSDEVSYSR